MSATTFARLSRELRDMIWLAAAQAQYQQPASCIQTSPYTERLRQAFIGYENLPHNVERQPLRVYIYGSHNRDKLRLRSNEFWALVNRLPMATVCYEARSHAVAFCQAQIGLVNLFYITHAPDDLSDIGDEISKPIFKRQTTVMVTSAFREEDGPKGFDSAEHLIDVVYRVFGNCVKRIILSAWFESFNSLAEIYWPHTAEIMGLQHARVHFKGDQGYNQPAVFMTPKRTVYKTDEFMDPEGFDLAHISQHLLKFYEIVDASMQKLPHLQSIELELHTYSWRNVYLTHIKATNKDRVLWVYLDGVQIKIYHKFDGICGRRLRWDSWSGR